MIGLIDTHFHLDLYKNHQEIVDFLNEKKIYTLCVTNSPGIYESCRKLYSSKKYTKFAMGFHPMNHELTEKDFTDFMWLLPRVLYVGEVGLDYSAKKTIAKEKQKYYFDKIIEKCAEQNKLITVHLRKAEDEAIKIITRYKPQKCIIHWFAGTESQLQQLIECECYFSVNANMIVSNLELVKKIPLKKILIESDGPFSKVNGKKYRPELLLQEYEIIAKALDEPDLISVVYNNFYTLLTKE